MWKKLVLLSLLSVTTLTGCGLSHSTASPKVPLRALHSEHTEPAPSTTKSLKTLHATAWDTTTTQTAAVPGASRHHLYGLLNDTAWHDNIPVTTFTNTLNNLGSPGQWAWQQGTIWTNADVPGFLSTGHWAHLTNSIPVTAQNVLTAWTPQHQRAALWTTNSNVLQWSLWNGKTWSAPVTLPPLTFHHQTAIPQQWAIGPHTLRIVAETANATTIWQVPLNGTGLTLLYHTPTLVPAWVSANHWEVLLSSTRLLTATPHLRLWRVTGLPQVPVHNDTLACSQTACLIGSTDPALSWNQNAPPNGLWEVHYVARA